MGGIGDASSIAVAVGEAPVAMVEDLEEEGGFENTVVEAKKELFLLSGTNFT